jgi:molybdopterin/thiamine biosynthesis adenylyltransferase
LPEQKAAAVADSVRLSPRTSDNQPMIEAFSYSGAFARNLGWVTEAEQAALRGKTVAIAGLGGVGGVHLLTLCRLGIGNFHVADFDEFAIANFNRQIGASVSNLGRSKVDTLVEMSRDINPELKLKTFPQGIDEQNIESFLDGVDIYVDGLDFFAFKARQMVFAACARKGIPAVTVAPVGMGAALLNFMPGQMSFDDYFQWGDLPDDELALRFLVGLSPARLHQRYLVDMSRVDFRARRTPSTIMGCQLCAGIAATEALKILLRRGRVQSAPHGLQFDAYRNMLVHTWRPGGNRHPLQRLAIRIGRRQLKALDRQRAEAAA